MNTEVNAELTGSGGGGGGGSLMTCLQYKIKS